MKRILLAGTVCLAVCLSLFLSGCSSDASELPKGERVASWGPVSNGLQCRLLPAIQTVQVAEGAKAEEIEIYLTYELRNMDSETVTFFRWHCPLADAFALDIFDPNGRRVPYFGPIPARAPHLSDFSTIRPGQSVARTVRLLYDFSKPSTYKISTKKFDDEEEPKSYYHMKSPQGGDTERAESNPDNVSMGLIKSNTVEIEIQASR